MRDCVHENPDYSPKEQMAYDFYNRKTVENWLNDKRRPKGTSINNDVYRMLFTDLSCEFAKNNMITYFLIREKNMAVLYSMFQSGRKQRKLCKKLLIELEKYQIEDKWLRVFKSDTTMMRHRIEHVRKIIMENIRLTDTYPFFNEVGFERLLEFADNHPIKEEETGERLKEEIETWNAEHQEEIQAYMESIAEEKAIHDAYVAKVEADRKDEKEAKRAAKKAERDEIKEIKKNNEAYQKEKRRIDRSFNYLFK